MQVSLVAAYGMLLFGLDTGIVATISAGQGFAGWFPCVSSCLSQFGLSGRWTLVCSVPSCAVLFPLASLYIKQVGWVASVSYVAFGTEQAGFRGLHSSFPLVSFHGDGVHRGFCRHVSPCLAPFVMRLVRAVADGPFRCCDLEAVLSRTTISVDMCMG